MSKQELLKKTENKSLKGCILTSAIMCYISAAITFIISFSNLGLPQNVILDAILILILGLLIHLKNSFPASVVLLVYGLINTVVMTIVMHQFGGWLTLLAGGFAVYGTYKLNKLYKELQNNAPQSYVDGL